MNQEIENIMQTILSFFVIRLKSFPCWSQFISVKTALPLFPLSLQKPIECKSKSSGNDLLQYSVLELHIVQDLRLLTLLLN